MIVVPSLHPAFLLRSGDGAAGEARFRLTVIGDFKKAREMLTRGPRWNTSAIVRSALFPTLEDVGEFCAYAREKNVSIDVETTGTEPLDSVLICVGMAAGDRVLCVPRLRSGGLPYWSDADWYRVHGYLKWLFADLRTPKTFWNVSFDSIVLWRNGLPVSGYIDDLMLAHHVVDGELPHSLAYSASVHLELEHWKDDVKGDKSWLELDDHILRKYNCLKGSTTVLLSDGTYSPIAKLVREHYEGSVRCVLPDGTIGDRRVVGWYRSRVPDQAWVQLSIRGDLDPIAVTPDHRIAILGPRGYEWREAAQIVVGDRVLVPELRWTPVQEIRSFTPPRLTAGERYRADTRYCIDVEEGGCFFTRHALVHNCIDCLVTERLREPLLTQAKALGVTPLYRKEVREAQIMVGASIRGLELDFQRRDDTTLDEHGEPRGLGPKLRKHRGEALGVLQSIAGNSEFKPGSVIQLRKLLFERLRFPVVRTTDKGSPSTDKQAMILLALHAESDAQIAALKQLARWRRCDKMLGTWVEGLPILGDGRLHVGWKIHGAVTGRFSSSPNAQNWNDAIKKLFRAGAGQVFVGVDLAQAELRGVGYLANDPDMLYAYQHDLNVHTLNATLLFQLRNPGKDTNQATEDHLRSIVPQMLGLDYASLPVAPPVKWHRFRHLAKRFVFACVERSTPIGLLNGKKPICEVAPGDWTWCWDGEKYAPTKVKRVVNHGYRTCVKLTMRDGVGKLKTLIVTPDHEMILRDGSRQAVGCLLPGARLMPFRRYVARGRCSACYTAWYRALPNHVVVSIEPLWAKREVWDLEVEHPAHNFALEKSVFVSNCNYGAMPETIYENLRADRDQVTDEPMFPDLTLGMIEALMHMWETFHPAIPRWRHAMEEQVHRDKRYVHPVSGRIQWYRGGFKMNELVNRPVQGLTADHMLRMIEIAGALESETRGRSSIVAQVHDALFTETPEEDVAITKEILVYYLSQPFSLPGHPICALPPDEPKVGKYLDQV